MWKSTPEARTTNGDFVIEQSVARVTRDIACELGEEYKIRPFFAVSLMRLSRQEALELCERAVKLFPHDLEGRGFYVRRATQKRIDGAR